MQRVISLRSRIQHFAQQAWAEQFFCNVLARNQFFGIADAECDQLSPTVRTVKATIGRKRQPFFPAIETDER